MSKPVHSKVQWDLWKLAPLVIFTTDRSFGNAVNIDTNVPPTFKLVTRGTSNQAAADCLVPPSTNGEQLVFIQSRNWTQESSSQQDRSLTVRLH